MSGIAAIVHNTANQVDESLIRLMAGSMALRGPDDQAYRISRDIGLAQSTFAHSDTDDALCFLGNEEIWLSAFVRIDAQAELLTKLGHKALTKPLSDEELLIQAYQKWGTHCLDHLIGDFAFILWDSRNKILLCATDQFGVAPLYYANTKHGVCVSNNINTIRLHPDITDELNEQAIADYLISRKNPAFDTTFFQSIKQLPAAHKLIFQNGYLRIEKYKSIDTQPKLNYKKPKHYIEEFQHLLKSSIQDRLFCSNIGADLSGGMDSTTITALAHDLLTAQDKPFNLQAYTLGSNGLVEDLESPLARSVVKSRKIQHNIFTPDKNRLIPELTPLHLISPEPAFISRSGHRTAKLEHIKSYRGTLLTGFGGDPLLHPRGLCRKDVNSLSSIFSLAQQSLYHYQAFGKRPRYRINRPAYTPSLPTWLTPKIVEQSLDFQRQHSGPPEQTSEQYRMTQDPMWHRLFNWNDPGFTHIPVKVSHPFFDTRLLDFALKLPPFPWCNDKYLLRQSMTKHLPNSIINRAKTGVPGSRIDALLSSQGLHNETRALLLNPRLQTYVNGPHLIELCTTSKQAQKQISFGLIMGALTLSYWLNHYELIPNEIRKKSLKCTVRKID